MIPPLVDISLVVELSALVVEAVSDFMSYHHSDPTEVQRLGEVLVVKRWLKNPSGKHDLVSVPRIVGVHVGRGCCPLGPDKKMMGK